MAQTNPFSSDPTQVKIIATLGPASSSADAVRRLIRAGVDGFRFNFSHGTHDSHRQIFVTARECIQEADRPLALIQDIQGPKLRVGRLENGSLELREDAQVFIAPTPIQGSGDRFSVSYRNLLEDVQSGEILLLDDGKIRLEADGTRDGMLACRVLEGGVLLENKGVNLPGTTTSLPPLTEKDLADIEFGVTLGFDYVALSFVQKADDIELLRNTLKRFGRQVPIIAKLERPAVLSRLDEIIPASDMVMVARGDLGIEVRVERVPVLQKQIIRKANILGVPVITATQMLESMIEHHFPTRAEATDVANAVYDGTDAVMLSGETSVGHDPVRVVAMMKKIIREAEAFPEAYTLFSSSKHEPREDPSVAHALCHLASSAYRHFPLKGIWIYTQTGATAVIVSKFKPQNNIYAFSPYEQVRRRMALLWGVTPMEAPVFESSEACIQWMNDHALKTGLARSGDVVAVTVGSPIPDKTQTNLLKLHVISEN